MTQNIRTIAVFLALIAIPIAAISGEKSLRWMSFNDGLAEAKKAKKKILIDVYTDWCGWCKRMDSQTYADASVAAYLTEKYIIIKLNAESDRTLQYRGRQYTQRELAAAFGIDGYPSTIFLRSDGEPITIYPGFADAKQFLSVLSFIAEDHYLTTKFQDYIGGKK